jgi:hypothetical protein
MCRIVLSHTRNPWNEFTKDRNIRVISRITCEAVLLSLNFRLSTHHSYGVSLLGNKVLITRYLAGDRNRLWDRLVRKQGYPRQNLLG